jgi:predicted DNA-binding protein with PD1-like motif
MKVKNIDTGFILVFEPQEKVIETFTKFCEENNINGGIFNGIGAFDYVKIGHFNTTTKRYMEHEFRESLEVLSVKGNITEKEGKPFIHMHAMVSDTNMRVYGGHLVEANVSVTLEVYVRKFEEKISRKYYDEIGLYLID